MSHNGLLNKISACPRIFTSRFKTSKSNATSTFGYCLDLIKKNDHENFLCTLLLPHQIRNTAIAIRAFNVEVSKAAAASKDNRISLMRLKFWEETIERIFAKNPPNQPVAVELTRVLSSHDLKKRQFLRLIKARAMQLDQNYFTSLEKMESYSEETVSPVFYLILEAAGIKNVHADHVASHLGKAQGLTNLLRATGTQGGSWGLPKDLMESAGVNINRGLIQNSESSKDVVYKIASRAKAHLEKARSFKSDLPKGSSIHFLPAVPTNKFLDRLSDSDFNIFDHFLHERDFLLGTALFWAKLTKSY